MTAAARVAAPPALAPFSLRDAPSFIERQFPVGRLSAEVYKERKANLGQTLTGLGSYWKGRKPLILARAVVLGCLLPATDDAAADLDIFLKLMAMDDHAFGRRFDKSAAEFARAFPDYAELATEERGRRRVWREDLDETERQKLAAEALASLPYAERVAVVRRPEECDEAELLGACLLNPGEMGFEPLKPVGEPDAANSRIRFDVRVEALRPCVRCTVSEVAKLSRLRVRQGTGSAPGRASRYCGRGRRGPTRWRPSRRRARETDGSRAPA